MKTKISSQKKIEAQTGRYETKIDGYEKQTIRNLKNKSFKLKN